MNKQVVIIGAGGHGIVIADVVRLNGDTVLGFLDDDTKKMPEVCGIPVLGCVEDYVKYPDAWFIAGTGKTSSRRKMAALLQNVKWYTAIHPSAVVSNMETEIGEGTVVLANAVINACAKVGKHAIINTAAAVDHEGYVGDFCHVAVGAKLAGAVVLGEGSWIGIGACVSNNIKICEDCMIGAGAVVVRNIEEPGTYVGVPARKIK